MTNVKMSLNIILPGSVMYSKQECLKQLKKTIKTKNGKKIITETVDDWNKTKSETLTVTNKGKKETIKYTTRKCKPASQTINITKESYEYMTSKEAPYWAKQGTWNRLTKEEKLKAHLIQIVEHLNGISYSYTVFDD